MASMQPLRFCLLGATLHYHFKLYLNTLRYNRDTIHHKGVQMNVARKTAIARLRRDCEAAGEKLVVTRSIKDRNTFGECYVTNSDRTLVQNGSIEEVMRDRKLLREGERVEG